MLALATKVTLRRSTSWTGHVVRCSGDMTLVAWTTGPLAGESKWHDTANLADVAEVESVDYCGDPVDPDCGPDLGLPWCHYHAGTSTNPYAA